MKIEVFTLCEYANVEASGKMNIIAAFDRLNAKEAPVFWLTCSIAAKLRFQKIEQGTKRIKFTLIDCDGLSVMPPVESELLVMTNQEEPDVIFPLALFLPPLKLPHFGEYSLDVAVDGRHEMGIPLYVRQMKEPAATLNQSEQPA